VFLVKCVLLQHYKEIKEGSMNENRPFFRPLCVYLLLFILTLIVFACGGGGDVGSDITTPELTLSETSYDFAGVVLNNNADHEFLIINTGSYAILKIYYISTPSAPFSIKSDYCSGDDHAMERNKFCMFIIRFSPTAQGSFSSAIFISSNDPPTRTVALYGVGYGLNVVINKVVSASCSSVVVDVTVTNPNGSLGILEKDNFTVTQNGGTQIITGFTTTDPDSVSEVLALDMSSRLTSALSNIRDGAKYFVDQLNNTDEAAIYKFKDDIIFYPSSSFAITDAAGKTDLKNYITLGPDPVTDGAALYDAVYDSITRAYNGTKSKKAVIVFSDGVNQKTTGKTLAEVIAYAQTLKVPIFTIYYVDPAHASDAKPEIMKQLAEETGGQDYYAETTTMEIIFGQISALLSKKYTITYAPTSCPVSPLLEVEVHSGGLTGLDTKTIVFP